MDSSDQGGVMPPARTHGRGRGRGGGRTSRASGRGGEPIASESAARQSEKSSGGRGRGRGRRSSYETAGNSKHKNNPGGVDDSGLTDEVSKIDIS